MQFYKRQPIVVSTISVAMFMCYADLLALLDESNTDQMDVSKNVNEYVSTYVLCERM